MCRMRRLSSNWRKSSRTCWRVYMTSRRASKAFERGLAPTANLPQSPPWATEHTCRESEHRRHRFSRPVAVNVGERERAVRPTLMPSMAHNTCLEVAACAAERAAEFAAEGAAAAQQQQQQFLFDHFHLLEECSGPCLSLC
mmetsp:Transcript_90657/g.290595  ORF Transcript_90657/g.290595 Transcript_90657/m.290595 type:complete len:141 (+) Transcript_90657:702-1124(+)